MVLELLSVFSNHVKYTETYNRSIDQSINRLTGS